MESEFFHSMFQISEPDIEWMEMRIGRKSINQLRMEVGLPLISGGDQPYTDWLRDIMGYKKPAVH
jgi:hypothetical protein